MYVPAAWSSHGKPGGWRRLVLCCPGAFQGAVWLENPNLLVSFLLMPKGGTALESCTLDLYTVRFRSGRTHAVICGSSVMILCTDVHVQDCKE